MICGAVLRYICMQELQNHCIGFSSVCYLITTLHVCKGELLSHNSCVFQNSQVVIHVHSGTLLLHCASTIRAWKIWLQVLQHSCLYLINCDGFIKGEISISCCYIVIKILCLKVNIQVLTGFNSTFQFKNSLELCVQLSESAIFCVNSTCGYQTV